MLSTYPACFYKEKTGGYSVIFPALNISTCGDTLDEAVRMAVDCLAGYLYSCALDDTPVPNPPKLEDIDVNAEYDDYETAFVNPVTVDADEYAKKYFSRSVKKTLTIPEWLNDAAVKANINFSRTLQKALKQELNMA